MKTEAVDTSVTQKPRKPYRSPRLTCLGALRKMTQSGSGAMSGDGGTMMP